MIENYRNGKVYLTGAGCGDPDLITIKAVKALQQAQVVLCDRLVSDEILNRYVPAHAEVLFVGKECRKGLSTPQSLINELMVDYALQGKTVVRLKGGDVSFFSNVLDELQSLHQHHIAYEIIPGITAASGASAYAGIPLTARGYSTAVRFLTCYQSDIVTAAYWRELAATNDTLVFYMSAATLPMVISNLIHNGITNDKKIAVIEQATTPMQHVHITSFDECETYFKQVTLASPSLIIIGKVVALHESYKWLSNSNNRELYFKPVTTSAAGITELNALKNAI